MIEYLWRVFRTHSSRQYNFNQFSGNCLNHPVPTRIQGVQDLDLLLLVSFDKVPQVSRMGYDNKHFSEDSKRFVAGGFCGVSQSNKRPVLGEISVNYELLNKMIVPLTTDFERVVVETLHQIIHIMGFSTFAFPYYRDPNTGLALTLDQIVKGGTLRNKEVSLVVLPQVVRAAREHFDCNDLEGLELEDEGGENIAGNHWERRVAEEDIMMGITDSQQGLTNYTIGLLEGTGWYQLSNY